MRESERGESGRVRGRKWESEGEKDRGGMSGRWRV